MTQEYTNDQIRKNNGQVIARAGLRQHDIDRLLKDFEGQHYLTADDHDRLLRKGRQTLFATPGIPEDYTQCGHSIESCRNTLIALLRVPSQNPGIEENLNPQAQTDEEIKVSSTARKEGAKIARTLLEKKTASYEDFRTSVDSSSYPKEVEEALLGARADDSEVQLPSGEVLPAIKVLPRTLTAKESCTVLAAVRCVREGAPSALLMICETPGIPTPLCLKGLIGKEVETVLTSTIVSRQKLLVYAQLKGRPISCRIRVTRGLRSADTSRTEFKLSKILWDAEQTKQAAEHFRQMDINFGEEVSTVD